MSNIVLEKLSNKCGQVVISAINSTKGNFMIFTTRTVKTGKIQLSPGVYGYNSKEVSTTTYCFDLELGLVNHLLKVSR